MTVAYVIGFTVRASQRDRFMNLLSGVLDAMREESTFVSATLHEDPATPDRFLLHEIWQDHQDVLDVQLSRPYRQAWHDALPEILDGPREVSIWTPLRTDRRP
jgi:quinol monooxygenase YgiN